MKAVFACLTVLALAAGCGGGSKQTSTTTAAELSVAQIVARTARKTGALRSFHFDFEVTHPAASTTGLNLTSAAGDVKVPNELKASVAGTLSGVSLTSELVFVAPHQYLKNPLSGAWETLDVATSPIGYFDPAKGVLAVIKRSIRLARDGSTTVGGVDCYRLRGKVHASDLSAFLGTPASDRLANIELDVGKDDLLLRRIEVAGPVAAGEPQAIDREVTLSRFDEPVSIQAPKVG